MKREIPKVFKLIYHAVFVLLFIFFVYTVISNAMDGFFPYEEYIAKKLQSPDDSKTAVLTIASGFDLNFIINVEYEGKTEQLFRSRDYNSDPGINWQENLIWSDDSSLLILTVTDYYNEDDDYIWAYDFSGNREYTAQQKILKILEKRNK